MVRLRLNHKKNNKKEVGTYNEIPGWVFLLVGSVIFIFSLTMNVINGNYSMTLFVIVGLGMVGWGSAKYFLFGKKGKSDLSSEELAKADNLEPEESPKNAVEERIHAQKNVKHCPSCGYALNKHDNYCYNCGEDVRYL